MASSCANNLLGDSPTTGITVCISSVRFSYLLFFSFLFFSFLFFSFLFFSFLFFFNNVFQSVQHGNCTVMFEVGLDGLVTCKGGQMVITSMDARYEEIKGQGERERGESDRIGDRGL